MCFTPLCVPIETGDAITYHIPSFLISDFLWVSSMNICIYVCVYIYICVCVCVCVIQGFPGGSNGKESACSVRDPGSIPGLGKSLGEGNVFYPLGILAGRIPWKERSLAGYSPWGCKELDTTE